MQAIPFDVFKFRDLVTLKLDKNTLKRVPFAIRKMTALKHIGLSNNSLESLPSVLELCRLDTLDLYANHFSGLNPTTTDNSQMYLRFPSLFEIAARFVELKRWAEIERALSG